jgi:hypothetical protein
MRANHPAAVSAQKKRPPKDPPLLLANLPPLVAKSAANQRISHTPLAQHPRASPPPVVINIDPLPRSTAVLGPLTGGSNKESNGDNGGSKFKHLSKFWGGGVAAHKSTGFSVLGEDDLGLGNDSVYGGRGKGKGKGGGGDDALHSPINDDDNDDNLPTNTKVSTYSFF